MKDYTEIFSKAIELSSGYNIEKICDIINAIGDNYCGTDSEWCTYCWYDLCRKTADNKMIDTYGYLSVDYPVALIKENCPDVIKSVLSENNILFTEFEEPMRCKEDILRKYVYRRRVIDESAFLNDGDFSYDDERFELILDRIETGWSCYIDASNFMFCDIYTA
ncbi:MAG: hypothetical protein NC177_01210 [Ruminococcus flavefaciens]|nr:hypothetical protein [Ruminococcus flavefaciens]